MMERKEIQSREEAASFEKMFWRLSDVVLVDFDALIVLEDLLDRFWPGSAGRAGTLSLAAMRGTEKVPVYLRRVKRVRLWLWYFGARRVDVQLIRHY